MTGCAISVENLTKKFDDFVALDNVSFSVAENCIFGYLGPNGAGKTTTIRILINLLEPDCGKVKILGCDRDRFEIVKPLIGVMSAERAYLAPHLSVERNLYLFGRLYGVEKQELRKRIEEQMQFFGLEEHRHKRMYELSRGLAVRANLCKALINSPKLLFLDEPTSGIDVSYSLEIRNYIRKLCESGCTIFLTTHNMYEAEQLTDYIFLLNKGKVVTSGRKEELLDKLWVSTTREIKVRCNQPKALESVLLKEGYAAKAINDEVIVKLRHTDNLNTLLSKAAESVTVYLMSEVEPSLEDLIRHIYGKLETKA